MVLRKIRTPIPEAANDDAYNGILYVEDDDDNWELTFVALRDKFQLQRAKDSFAAFEAMRKRKFDIVLMDIELSGSRYNGIEITERLKKVALSAEIDQWYEKNHDTPVVFVTAYGARYSKNELISAGASDVIEKPVDFSRLSRVITKLTLRETYAALSHIRKNMGR